jgi:hypothetical protein
MGYKGADLKIPGKSCGIRRKANKGAGLSAEPNRPNLGPARKPLQGVYNFGYTFAPYLPSFRQHLRVGPHPARRKAQNWCIPCGYGWESGKTRTFPRRT